MVLLSMSGRPTLPVGEPCGEVAVGGGGGGGGGGTTGGCERAIAGAGGGGGGGEPRISFGRCAADMLANRLWKEAADVYGSGIPGGNSGGGAR